MFFPYFNIIEIKMCLTVADYASGLMTMILIAPHKVVLKIKFNKFKIFTINNYSYDFLPLGNNLFKIC